MKDFLSLAVIAAVCLSFKPSRNFGFALLGLLFLAHPSATIGTLLIAGIAYPNSRRNNHVQRPYLPGLPARCLSISLAWDLEDDDQIADAVNAQARLMAGINPEDISGWPSEPTSL